MMHILFVHNAYQQRGGEDSVVQAEIDLLRHYGHEVVLYRRDNREIDDRSRASVARDTVWSRQAGHELAALAKSFQPDVVHLHNTFPLISPSAYWALAALGKPMVQTLHNFRLLCLKADFLRHGRVCEDCLGRFPWRGVWHRCYRDSAAASATLAAMLAVHRGLGTFQCKVTRFIALNDYSRRKFIAGGLPAQRIVIKPHFVDVAPAPAPDRHGGLFVGRLSPGKGVTVLLEALRHRPEATLTLVGTGPLESALRGHPRVHVQGWQAPRAVYAHMHRAAYLVVPSRSESFGLVVLEAFACGLPVIASRLGALAELIVDGRTGLLFEPGSANALAERIAWAEAHPEAMRAMGLAARAEYEAKYTPEKNYWQLMTIYADAIEHRRGDEKTYAGYSHGHR
jgi:glycosyltransferase involved in cell wall biosynthesis